MNARCLAFSDETAAVIAKHGVPIQAISALTQLLRDGAREWPGRGLEITVRPFEDKPHSKKEH